MVATEFTTVRDLVLHYAGRRGWRTQRRIAVTVGLDETAFSRFLDGKQDIGAVATFELFRAVRVPAEQYPLAFELLGRAQEEARCRRDARSVLLSRIAFDGRMDAETAIEALDREEAAFTADAVPHPPASPIAGMAPAPPAPEAAPPAPPAGAGGPVRQPSFRLPVRRRATGRDVAALARDFGIEPERVAEVPTFAVIRLFEAEDFTGREIAEFFAGVRRGRGRA